MPNNLILLWAGAIADIPAGWVLCDGTNGSPDLRDKFVVQVGTTYNPEDEGGNVNHNHNFNANSHNHAIIGAGFTTFPGPFSNQTDARVVTGTTDNGANIPLYYALAYVMKL